MTDEAPQASDRPEGTHFGLLEDWVLGLEACSACGLPYEAWDAAPHCPGPSKKEPS